MLVSFLAFLSDKHQVHTIEKGALIFNNTKISQWMNQHRRGHTSVGGMLPVRKMYQLP